MKIHVPRTPKNLNPPIYEGILRQIDKIRDNLWQVKITVPEYSIIDNLWLALDDEEMAQFIKTFQSSNKSETEK